MQGFHEKRDCHEILKKAKIELSLGNIGNHGVDSWCLLLALFFWSFVICLHLIYSFVYVWCMIMPLYLWCHITIGFKFLFLFVFLPYLLRFERLGILLGKEES